MKKLFALAVVAGAAFYFVKKQMEVAEEKKTAEELLDKMDDLEDKVEKLEEVKEEPVEEDPKDALEALIQETESLVETEEEEIDPLFSVEMEEEPAEEENTEELEALEPVEEETSEPEEVLENYPEAEEISEEVKEEMSLKDKANETARRLLSLQVDLVMANYPDDHIFLLQHSVEYSNEEKLNELMEDYRTVGYVVRGNGKTAQLEKVILQKKNEVKDEILSVANRVRFEGEIYKGFNVIPQ